MWCIHFRNLSLIKQKWWKITFFIIHRPSIHSSSQHLHHVLILIFIRLSFLNGSFFFGLILNFRNLSLFYAGNLSQFWIFLIIWKTWSCCSFRFFLKLLIHISSFLIKIRIHRWIYQIRRWFSTNLLHNSILHLILIRTIKCLILRICIFISIPGRSLPISRRGFPILLLWRIWLL